MTVAFMLWRRLDTPGHDACRLEENDTSWILDGMSVFCQNGVPASLAYRVVCDFKWYTERGYVQGWIGAQPVELSIQRERDGVWTLNGVTVSNLENCIDLDLGFTPATNLVPLRRLALREDQAADSLAAWLDVSAGILEVLPQRYERRAGTKYWYEAPSVDYAAMLEVTQIGFIRRYPGLWEAEM
ncbi:putative glycolipid-binding domain-containing protein [Methanosarcina sp.]|uniref:putative glycolipid-binding domain-containing protein n=1 Tax=Methanosarcina sp. TaxID=2213 RepID=UPI003C78115F